MALWHELVRELQLAAEGQDMALEQEDFRAMWGSKSKLNELNLEVLFFTALTHHREASAYFFCRAGPC